jgi:hypothetical protein
MPQTLDIRMARAAKAEARARRDPTQARHRSLLRARAALCALLRGRSAPPDADRAFAGALQLGDAAAVELASIPDTPATAVSPTLPMLRRPDCWLLASRAPQNGRGHLPAPRAPSASWSVNR